MVNVTVALSVPATPSWSMDQRKEFSVRREIVPLVAVGALMRAKSGLSASLITMFVAPGTEILAARSAKSCSRSALVGAIRHMGDIRVGGPVVERVDVDSRVPNQADAVDRVPQARAAAAMGAGGSPVVVSPSVNITITRLFVEPVSRAVASVNASPWLVRPPAVSARRRLSVRLPR